MGWFKQLKKGNIGKAFKEATNSVKGVAVPVIAGAVGNALLPGLGGFLGKTFGTGAVGSAITKGLTSAAGGIIGNGVSGLLGGGSGGGTGGVTGGQMPTQDASGNITIPGQGQKGLGMNDLLALYAMTSKDKPDIRNAPNMAELAANAKNIPGWGNVEATTGQNDPMIQQMAAIDAQGAQAAGTNFGADANDVNASLNPLVQDAARVRGTNFGVDPKEAAAWLDPLQQDAKRLQGLTLGFGNDRYKALRENFTSDLNDQFDSNQKKIAANMAARGMKGGVYNNAQNLNVAENQKQARLGLNDLLVQNENAIRDDRWKQSAGLSDNAGAQTGVLGDVAKLNMQGRTNQSNVLSDNANTQSGIYQDATKMNTQGRQTGEDVAARLLGLRGEAASKITGNALDAAKIGQTGIATGIDAYKNELEKYKTDSEAWGNMFNGLAQAGSQFQAPTAGTTIKPDGTVAPAPAPAPVSSGYSGGDPLTQGLVDSFTNYFSNPNTTPGQKITNGISTLTKGANTIADLFNNGPSAIYNKGTGRTYGTQYEIEKLRNKYSRV